MYLYKMLSIGLHDLHCVLSCGADCVGEQLCPILLTDVLETANFLLNSLFLLYLSLFFHLSRGT